MESRVGPDMKKSEFWSNFACVGFKNEFLPKLLDDSAWFCMGKLIEISFKTKSLKILVSSGFHWKLMTGLVGPFKGPFKTYRL